jgi:hypothetical protein
VTEVPFGEEWAGELGDAMVDQGAWEDPADRPWVPIPHQARALDSGLIPAQRRLKKTSRSA